MQQCHAEIIYCPICSLQELSLRLAEKEGARIVLATDPDADRLAVAEQCDKSVILSFRHANSNLICLCLLCLVL